MKQYKLTAGLIRQTIFVCAPRDENVLFSLHMHIIFKNMELILKAV